MAAVVPTAASAVPSRKRRRARPDCVNEDLLSRLSCAISAPPSSGSVACATRAIRAGACAPRPSDGPVLASAHILVTSLAFGPAVRLSGALAIARGVLAGEPCLGVCDDAGRRHE